MKRLPPQTLQGKVFLFFQKFWPRLISVLVWIITVGFLAHNWSSRPVSEALTTVCILRNDVKKGENLQTDQIITKQVLAKDVPENSINDCTNEELTKVPLLADLQAGDVLQLSAFQKPEGVITLKEQLAQQQHIFYLPIKDLHAIPVPLEVGQELSILGKSKKAEEAQVLIDVVKVVDIATVKTDSEHEQVNSVGFALDSARSLSLTRALADGWFLLAVTK